MGGWPGGWGAGARISKLQVSIVNIRIYYISGTSARVLFKFKGMFE